MKSGLESATDGDMKLMLEATDCPTGSLMERAKIMDRIMLGKIQNTHVVSPYRSQTHFRD